MTKNKWLIAGGLLSLIAALMHVAIVIGGADWYRFFGAGEQMAQMAEQGSSYPAMVTALIALVLTSWAAYGFSGAGVLPRLPFMRLALITISGVYLARALFGIPAVIYFDTPYFQELGQSQSFMWISSLICLVYGLCFSVGAWQVWPQLGRRPQPPQVVA